MHYYQFNISDYRKRTGHLTLLEHAIYRSLIDTYYLEELPLCGDIAKLMRTHSARSKDEKEAFNAVIDEFFVLTDSGYHHEKCDQELAKIYEKSAKARASAKTRWENHNAKAMRTHSEGNANGMLPNTYNLIPNNLKPKDQEIVSPKKKAKPRTKFKQPEPSDVFDYLLTRGIDQATSAIESEKFTDYYRSNGWKVGKNSMKCWKSAARNWTKNINKAVAKNGTQNGNQPRKSSMLDRVKQQAADRLRSQEASAPANREFSVDAMAETVSDVRLQIHEPVRGDTGRDMGDVLNGDYWTTNG